MKYREIRITGALIVLMAFVYCIAEPWEIIAVLIPAAVHELGHITAIKLQGLHIKAFRAEMKGFCIDYYGSTGPFGHILTAAAGPAAGFIYAYLASKYSVLYESRFLALSSGISLLLSLFNLLPVMPLDGGRISEQLFKAALGEKRGEGTAKAVSLFICVLLMATGLCLLLKNKGAAMLISSIWLLFYQESGKGIVKAREIL